MTSSEQSSIESFHVLSTRLCIEWGDTKKRLDEHIVLFLSGAMIAILDSIPNVYEEQELEDLKRKNEAIEELEFLHELLQTGCRHNNYGQK